jgi:hypothetical protein
MRVSKPNGTNGTAETNGQTASLEKRRRSIGLLDEEARKEQEQADQHVASYVQDQLRRLRTDTEGLELSDELETRG